MAEPFTLYKKADVDGYLDKINSGITSKFLSGKTRVWCELYGSMLYVFKDTKRSSSGSQPMDMTQAHMVRRTNTDKSGLHFDILCKNKQHTFCAATGGECERWVRHLQVAMTLKDTESTAPHASTAPGGDYETIEVLPEDDPSTPHIQIGASSQTDPGYSEVHFPTFPAPSNSMETGGGGGQDDGYAEVEFRKSQGTERPVIPPTRKSNGCDLPSAPPPSTPPPSASVEDAACAPVEMRKKSVTERTPSITSQSTCGPEADSTDIDLYPYAKVQRKPASATDISKAESTDVDAYPYAKVQRKVASPSTDAGRAESCPRMLADGSSDVSSDEDEALMAAGQRDPDPIPAFPHPLQPQDLEPLAALREFLAANRKLCRPSLSHNALSLNPVGDLKTLLTQLHL
ncbi:uncharacterized protein LOC143292348 isoform X2 [Babylonia areolata]|uniref:uncharacterized protein LOC143292348 isoform X2 n=1 Tax=Babylonia areolata TaxID=304850 RepID=UPI003FD501EE